jgi:uridine kinase
MQQGKRRIQLSELLQKYEEKTKPAFEKFIEPTKKFANTIIPNYGFSTQMLNTEDMAIVGVDVIVDHVIKQQEARNSTQH